MICIDHEEDGDGNPVVRGLLCRRCNVGIGIFEHNIDNLRAAISYLQKEHHNTHVDYGIGEILDKLSVVDLKIYHISERLELKLDDEERNGISRQLDSLKAFRLKLIKALEYHTDEKTTIGISNISGIHLKLWHIEDEIERIRDDKEQLERIDALLDQVVTLNKLRVDIVGSIEELFDNK
jgi:hypothetical protein